jgi:hypothetical protein
MQANKYYDLVTSFYEYGWGESFHFANRLYDRFTFFICFTIIVYEQWENSGLFWKNSHNYNYWGYGFTKPQPSFFPR